MNLTDTKKEFLKLVAIKLKECDFKNIAKNIEGDYLKKSDKEIDKMIKTLHDCLTVLKEDISQLMEMNEKSNNFLKSIKFFNDYRYCEKVIIDSFPSSHSKFSLEDSQEQLKKTKKNADIILKLIEKIKEMG